MQRRSVNCPPVSAMLIGSDLSSGMSAVQVGQTSVFFGGRSVSPGSVTYFNGVWLLRRTPVVSRVAAPAVVNAAGVLHCSSSSH